MIAIHSEAKRNPLCESSGSDLKRRNKLLPAYYPIARAELKKEGGRREFNPPSELRSVSGSSRKAFRKADVDLTQLEAHFGEHTHTHTKNTVAIKRLGDMPDGPRRARLNADPRAELINNRDIRVPFLPFLSPSF